MFSEEQIVVLARDLPAYGLIEGTAGSVVVCYPAVSEYDVTFVPEGKHKVVTVRLAEADLRASTAQGEPDERPDPIVQKLREFLAEKLRDVYTNIDNYKVKEGVDSLGVERFINQCAILAATSGAASGSGGIATMIALPADALNLVIQHIRVAMAVIYHKTGSYDIPFAKFLPILGASLGITAGALTGGALVGHIAGRIAVRLVAGSAGRVVPILGMVVGGSLNYTYIKAVGKVLMKLKIEG